MNRSGFRVQGSEVQGKGLQVQGSRFRGSGFRVQGSAQPLAAEAASLIEKETLGDEVLMVS